MYINLTLFVQLIHFGIAYYLIKYLLLIPAHQAFQQDQQEHGHLVHDIAQQSRDIARQEHDLRVAWQTCQEQFKELSPDVQRVVTCHIEPTRKPLEPLDVHDVHEHIDQIAHAIVTEVTHD